MIPKIEISKKGIEFIGIFNVAKTTNVICFPFPPDPLQDNVLLVNARSLWQ